MAKKVGIIGSGFSSLSAACHLSKLGYEVHIFEKNESPGGRARQLRASGYSFDMGPSWYWMPDVFEHFFAQFDKKPSDYYQLVRLDPAYRVKFDEEFIDIPGNLDQIYELFEKLEAGSAKSLKKFLSQAAFKYEVGVKNLVYKPSRSVTEFMDFKLLSGIFKMDVFTSMSKHVRKFFKDERLIQLMEFPVLFLGSTADKTPALYSLMNYADLQLGTWYPMGGMYQVVKAMEALALELGTTFHFNTEVAGFHYNGRKVTHIRDSKGQSYEVDGVIAGSDYHHTDQILLEEGYRNYTSDYWQNRTMSPSSLLFYVGLDTKLQNMQHHVLFFDEDFKKHASDIYDHPQWPEKPLLYTSVTSLTDPTTAPKTGENLVILIPVAPGLEDNEALREKYFHLSMKRLEQFTGVPIRDHIIFKKSYAHNDFIRDYHSFKGNAYGLANTLRQTALLKPSLKNKKLSNFYYTGQLTVPGPGVPPSIISGEVVSREINKDFTKFS